MDVITIESEAFRQIIDLIKTLNEKFSELKNEATYPLTEKWLDNQEVCILLKISKRTLQYYRDEKTLPFSQYGNKIYYKATDIEKFLEENYQTV